MESFQEYSGEPDPLIQWGTDGGNMGEPAPSDHDVPIPEPIRRPANPIMRLNEVWPNEPDPIEVFEDEGGPAL